MKPSKKGGKARCWLKYGVPAPVSSRCCTSGVKSKSKRELILNRELKPRDWVFEVSVVNLGKTPVSNVGILVAVQDERLETIIEDTIERNKGSRARVYMRPSRQILSGKSVEVNAIVDPYDEYRENNEENNLITKTFRLKNP